MSVPHLYLLKCPKSIINYFNKMDIAFSTLSIPNELNPSQFIVISTWNPEVKECWIDTVKLLRRKGKFNPIILLSFQKEKDLLTKISSFSQGMFFLRLPFCIEELSLLLHNNSIEGNNFLPLQQLALQDYISSTWLKLSHGREYELINSILVPIRSSLLLPFDGEKKKEILANLIERINRRYWNSEEMLELKESIKELKPNNKFESSLKQIISYIDELLSLVAEYKSKAEDIKLIEIVDKIIKNISTLSPKAAEV